MTNAMERIKEGQYLLANENCFAVPETIEEHHDCGQCGFNGRFLLRAFEVMREIAIRNREDADAAEIYPKNMISTDGEFEERMKETK